MSDLRGVLERADRATERFSPPDPGFERLRTYRDRRRRNRRIGSAVLAIVIALAAVGSVVTAFRAGPRTQPAAPRITSANISRLQLKWKVQASSSGELLSMASTDGVVVTAGSTGSVVSPGPTDEGVVQAFAEDCGSDGSVCRPLWTATVHGAPWIPTAADGIVYVGADDLTAFSARCRTDGGVCEPLWTAKVEPGGAIQPVVSGGVVYVTAGRSPDAGRVYAFRTDCGTGGAICEPLWQSPLFGRPLLTGPVANGILYIGVWAATHSIDHLNRLYAFRVGCGSGGATCRPMWAGAVPHQVFASVPATSGEVLYVGTARNDGTGTFRAYDATCGIEPACEPVWSIHQPDALNIPTPVVGGGVIVTATRFSGRIRAWKPDPSGGPATLLWTACCPRSIADPDPVIADGIVYVASSLGVTGYPIDCTLQDAVCRSAWTSTGSAGIVRVSNGIVLVGRTDGTLEAYGLGPSIPPTPSATSRTWTPVFYALLALAVAVALIRRRRSMR